MKQILKQLFDEYKLSYTDKMLEQFEIYYEFLVEENSKYNLTAITEKNEVAIKHFLDCVVFEKQLEKNSTVVDVGAGAGFPSLPLKILRPDLNVVMIDSLNKRVNFLNTLIEKLNLTNIKALHFRAEDFANGNREKFDYAVSRAVANLSSLCEYCLPLVKVGGKMLAYKGQSHAEELEGAKFAICELGAKYEKTELIDIKQIQAQRALIMLQKVQKTNKKYPRGKNLPKTKPLNKESVWKK